VLRNLFWFRGFGFRERERERERGTEVFYFTTISVAEVV
jgi:hypothetical protein